MTLSARRRNRRGRRSELRSGESVARLNALPQFITEIDGLDIQFAHIRPPREDAPAAADDARLAGFDCRLGRDHLGTLAVQAPDGLSGST